MRRPRPSKRQRCLPLLYLILFQVNRHINLRAKGKISILTNLILVKGVSDTTTITKGAMIIPNPRQLTQWVKHVSRQPPTPRYEAYTPLNPTCVAIYPSITHLIPKSKLRHPDYKPTKNTSTFCYYHEHNGHDGEKCITLRDHIEALAREGKIDQFLLHPPRGNRNQRQVNVIYSISGRTPISKSSNRAMKNSERALRSGH
ncbi:hypothetical protein FF1_023117 [Malus domestica]